jgi:hypothetical protein
VGRETERLGVDIEGMDREGLGRDGVDKEAVFLYTLTSKGGGGFRASV